MCFVVSTAFQTQLVPCVLRPALGLGKLGAKAVNLAMIICDCVLHFKLVGLQGFDQVGCSF